MTATLLLPALLEQAALLRLVALPGGGRALEGPASAVAGGGGGSGERAGGRGRREGRLSVSNGNQWNIQVYYTGTWTGDMNHGMVCLGKDDFLCVEYK